MAKHTGKPRKIIIEQQGEDYKLYKQWSKTKTQPLPYFITDQLQELVDKYREDCTSWGLNPDMKLIYKIISKNQNN